jgi:CDP-diacylglycerol pyrophosphatase
MRWRLWLAPVAALALAGGCSIIPAGAADPSALWNIVNGQCVPHQKTLHEPGNCAEVVFVHGDAGYAILKDIRGATQYLLIPTTRISGIEDPQILAPDALNYFAYAWKARSFTEARLGEPQKRDVITLAINSYWGRTQNQLHIHIDCVRADVRATLAANLDKVGPHWAPFPAELVGHHYQAIRINGSDLGSVNPFRVLADGDPAAAKAMGKHTLVLVGETFPDGANGFVLLDDTADLAKLNRGSGEELQDHACATAERPA